MDFVTGLPSSEGNNTILIIVHHFSKAVHFVPLPKLPAPAYSPGQEVWLSSRDLPLQVESRKLAPSFVGPYVIDSIINPVAVKLKLPPSLNVHPVFHVSLLKPVSSSTLCPPAPGFPSTRRQIVLPTQW